MHDVVGGPLGPDILEGLSIRMCAPIQSPASGFCGAVAVSMRPRACAWGSGQCRPFCHTPGRSGTFRNAVTPISEARMRAKQLDSCNVGVDLRLSDMTTPDRYGYIAITVLGPSRKQDVSARPTGGTSYPDHHVAPYGTDGQSRPRSPITPRESPSSATSTPDRYGDIAITVQLQNRGIGVWGGA
jgi:hypothetical protein